jgi:hypothetical protein
VQCLGEITQQQLLLLLLLLLRLLPSAANSVASWKGCAVEQKPGIIHAGS